MWCHFAEEPNNRSGTLLYSIKNQEFFYSPWQKNDYSFVLGNAYCSLDILATTGEAVQIAGLNPMRNWIEKPLVYPSAKCGRVFLHDEKTFLPGTGDHYGEDWKTYYDPHHSYICMGSPEEVEGVQHIEFSEGIVASIRNGKLLSIWGKITIIR